MSDPVNPGAGQVVVVGGTSGLGLEVATRYAAMGRQVVISGRNLDRTTSVAAGLSHPGRTPVRPVALDLAVPAGIDAAFDAALDGADTVGRLVLAAIERDDNSVAKFDADRAGRLMTIKLVGYLCVVHALLGRMTEDTSIVVFGGQAAQRPYPGSTTISTVNGGVVGMVNTLASELAPIRVNGIHPGIVGDSPYWRDRPPQAREAIRSRTPTGRLVTMAQVTDTVAFLLENPGINGVNLAVDGGWLLR
jgi:NAD(P)-dependent dehydrogenase (short-subunit alcohol dehydrogenase family)